MRKPTCPTDYRDAFFSPLRYGERRHPSLRYGSMPGRSDTEGCRVNIAQKTFAIVAIAVIATMAVSGYFVWSAQGAVGNLEQLANTEIELIEHGQNIRSIQKGQQTTVAAYLAGPADVHLAEYNELTEALHEELEAVEAQLTAIEFEAFEELHHEIDELAEVEEQLFALVAAGNLAEAQALEQSIYLPQLEHFEHALSTFAESQHARLNATVAGQIDAVNQGRNVGIVLSVIALLAMTIAGWRFSSSVSGRINRLAVVSDKLSQGEVDGLVVNVSGSDEIGRLGESLQGVLAAFELLRDEAIRNEAEAERKAA